MRWVLVAAVGSLLVEVSVRKWLHLSRALKKSEKQKKKLEEKCKQLQKKYDSERVHQQVEREAILAELKRDFDREWRLREQEWRQKIAGLDQIKSGGGSGGWQGKEDLESWQNELARLREEAIAINSEVLLASPRKTAFEKARSKKHAPPGSTSPLRDKLVKQLNNTDSTSTISQESSPRM